VVKNSVIYKKISFINNNINRLRSKQHISEKEFVVDYDVRESVLLNLQQAIQGCIDVGSHIIADNGWGTPGSTSEIFYILQENKIISTTMAETMVKMCGFRNLIVHQYDDIDFEIVYFIYQHQIKDFEDFLNEIQIHFAP